MAIIAADEEKLGARMVGTLLRIQQQREIRAVPVECDGKAEPTALCPAPVQFLQHQGAAGADQIDLPVDHQLRRIDRPELHGMTIAPLPVAHFLGRKRILPADIVPVVDMVGERQYVRFFRQLAQQFIRRRTGGAALAREEFKNDRTGPAACRHPRPGGAHQGSEAEGACGGHAAKKGASREFHVTEDRSGNQPVRITPRHGSVTGTAQFRRVRARGCRSRSRPRMSVRADG